LLRPVFLFSRAFRPERAAPLAVGSALRLGPDRCLPLVVEDRFSVSFARSPRGHSPPDVRASGNATHFPGVAKKETRVFDNESCA
jgi:hypothetical protein